LLSGLCHITMSRPCTPSRESGGRTPRRDGRGQQNERGTRTPCRDRPAQRAASQPDLLAELALQDASQFPALPTQLPGLPRGRKDRRSCEDWENFKAGDPNRPSSRPSSRSVSRSGRFKKDQIAQDCHDTGRTRACSFDAAVDTVEHSEKEERKPAPTTPRSSILKKSRSSTGRDDGDSEAQEKLAKVQEELQQKMKEMMALMGKSQASDVQTQMAQHLTKLLDSAATEPAAHQTQQTVPSTEDSSKEISMRPRRLSNPQPAPSGSSWEYPLSKEEKKARVVMISSAEIDSLTEENGCLIEEVARLSIDTGK